MSVHFMTQLTDAPIREWVPASRKIGNRPARFLGDPIKCTSEALPRPRLGEKGGTAECLWKQTSGKSRAIKSCPSRLHEPAAVQPGEKLPCGGGSGAAPSCGPTLWWVLKSREYRCDFFHSRRKNQARMGRGGGGREMTGSSYQLKKNNF